MKNTLRTFYFTKNERKSLFTVALIMILLLASMFLLQKIDKPKTYSFEELDLEKVLVNEDSSYTSTKPKTNFKKQINQSKFNPNTISADSLMVMGFNKYGIKNLMKYRAKGGKIKDVEHFYKIYGMEKYKGKFDNNLVFNETNNDLAQKDSSFIQSENENKHVQNIGKSPIPIVSLRTIDINKADSFELQSLKGIGSVMSKRIIKYRDALGGFYDVNQIEEVYGLNPQTFMEINHLLKIDLSIVKLIAINKVDEVTLEKHPYISKKQASIIIKYRNNHGGFKSLEDFAKMKIFTESEIEKLSHYLTF